MAPKDKKAERGQQKAEEKIKQKIVEDKTFGLKNKNKSKAVQRYIKGVQAQAKVGPQKSDAQLKEEEIAKKEAKKKEKASDALLASLFKGTENIKKVDVKPHMDPTAIREGQRIDLYSDTRETKGMEGWNQSQLEEVIMSKHSNAGKNATDKICNHFLDAIEKKQYGWFWVCPNGGELCKYRHCLPPGFVLKMDEPVVFDDEEEELLEDIIERERAALPEGGTPVTLKTLIEWKKKKEQEKAAELQKQRDEEVRKSAGKGHMSGRDLFTFDPTLFIDDEGAASDEDYDSVAGSDESACSAEVDKSDNDCSADSQDASASVKEIAAEHLDEKAYTFTGAAVKRVDLFVAGDEPNLDILDD